MKISYNWLKQYLEINETPEQIGQYLTQVGLEVENIETYELLAGGLKGIVIGEILTCEKHPNADKLSKTTVAIGNDIVLPIVCGASNVAQGQKVVVATVGAMLYPTTGEPFEIKKAKIRGEESQGMICAEDEIGLGSSHEGIMVLSTSLPNGTPAAQYFNLENDFVIEIGLTPNRVDAASHIGVARDLKIILQKPLQMPDLENFKKNNTTSKITVKIENSQACLRYAGVTLEGVEVKQSPEWLCNRLKTIGLTPINNVVDATNFVLHELGQPLHAFDADAILGNQIIVKNVAQNTIFQTLDGKERKLSENDLMICNAEAPMCIAGVFGGLDSGVSAKTQRIFLESAYFSPDHIRKTAQFHGLKTDASFRFERGTDPNMVIYALKRAALLIQEVAGGEVSSEIIDIYPNPIQNFEVEIKFKNIDRLIGKKLDKSLIKNYLEGLEMRILQEDETKILVSVPPYRVDVQREADVIEDILRLYGFNNIEISGSLSSSFIANFPLKDKFILQNRVSELLASCGLSEIITNSLTKPEYSQTLKSVEPENNVLMLNRLSEELEVLRQSLIFSGLEVISHNINRKQQNLKLFEFGKIYQKHHQKDQPEKQKYSEQTQLALYFTGNKTSETWLGKSEKVDFHFVAGIVEKVLKIMNVKNYQSQDADRQVFAYGLQYNVKGKIFAQIGLLQEYVLKPLNLKQSVFYVELDWEWLLKNYKTTVVAEEIAKFPEVKRDLSLILDKNITYQEIEQKAFQWEKKLLKRMNVFSVFEGEQIGENKKSYAISFFLQDNEQTLTDAQIDKTMQKIIQNFRNDFTAVIRE
jgi:phenylalanyl-tRNA synthetase beta chain